MRDCIGSKYAIRNAHLLRRAGGERGILRSLQACATRYLLARLRDGRNPFVGMFNVGNPNDTCCVLFEKINNESNRDKNNINPL